MADKIELIVFLRRLYLQKQGTFSVSDIQKIEKDFETKQTVIEEVLSCIVDDMKPKKNLVLLLKEVNRFRSLQKVIAAKGKATVCQEVNPYLVLLKENFQKSSPDCESSVRAAKILREKITAFSASVPNLVKALDEYAILCEKYFTNVTALKRLRVNIRFLPLAEEANERVLSLSEPITADIYWTLAEELNKSHQMLFKDSLYNYSVILAYLNEAIIRNEKQIPELSIPEALVLNAPEEIVDPDEEATVDSDVQEAAVDVEPVEEEEVIAEAKVAEETVAEENTVEVPIIEEPAAENAVVADVAVDVELTGAEEISAEAKVNEEVAEEEGATEESIIENTVVEDATAREAFVEETPVEEPVTEEPIVEDYIAAEVTPVKTEVGAEDTSVKTNDVSVETEAVATSVSEQPEEILSSVNAENETETSEIVEEQNEIKEESLITTSSEENIQENTSIDEAKERNATKVSQSAGENGAEEVAPVPADPTPTEEKRVLPNVTPKRKSRKPLWISLAVAAVLIGGASLWFVLSDGEDDDDYLYDLPVPAASAPVSLMPDQVAEESTSETTEAPVKDPKATLPAKTSPTPEKKEIKTKTEAPSEPKIVETKTEEPTPKSEVKEEVSGNFDALLKKAKAGNAAAQYQVGLCYEKGTGVKADVFEAITWYRKAKVNGSEAAANRLTELGY